VKTDLPIKVLFERQGQSLLPFVGEQGARLAGVDVVEVPAGSRTVDCVLRLERDGLTWYRHLEFQAERDPDIPRRCFEYNARLVLHYSAAVVTTVVYLLRGADRDVADAFRSTSGHSEGRPQTGSAALATGVSGRDGGSDRPGLSAL
jgi:hypothetical protein